MYYLNLHMISEKHAPMVLLEGVQFEQTFRQNGRRPEYQITAVNLTGQKMATANAQSSGQI
jgi:hypothetical protein